MTDLTETDRDTLTKTRFRNVSTVLHDGFAPGPTSSPNFETRGRGT